MVIVVVAPFSQYRFITPLLIALSVVLTAALIVLGVGSRVMLCVNWAAAGVLSYIIWDSISRFSLKGGRELKAFAISWPLLTACLHFGYCHFPPSDSYVKALLLVTAFLLFLRLLMSLWQERSQTSICLLTGALIGLLSVALPHALLWLLLFPVSGFMMRCWSMRNVCSLVSGTLFALWLSYCALFWFGGEARADAMWSPYAEILLDDDYGVILQGLGLWHYLYIGITVLLVIFYGVTGLLFDAGVTTRASSSIKLLSLIGLIYLLLMLFDGTHVFLSFAVLSMTIALQFTFRQSNVRSAMLEWWILVVILGYTALCILPIFLG